LRAIERGNWKLQAVRPDPIEAIPDAGYVASMIQKWEEMSALASPPEPLPVRP